MTLARAGFPAFRRHKSRPLIIPAGRFMVDVPPNLSLTSSASAASVTGSYG
jgi:hypothetical protein